MDRESWAEQDSGWYSEDPDTPPPPLDSMGPEVLRISLWKPLVYPGAFLRWEEGVHPFGSVLFHHSMTAPWYGGRNAGPEFPPHSP